MKPSLSWYASQDWVQLQVSAGVKGQWLRHDCSFYLQHSECKVRQSRAGYGSSASPARTGPITFQLTAPAFLEYDPILLVSYGSQTPSHCIHMPHNRNEEGIKMWGKGKALGNFKGVFIEDATPYISPAGTDLAISKG